MSQAADLRTQNAQPPAAPARSSPAPQSHGGHPGWLGTLAPRRRRLCRQACFAVFGVSQAGSVHARHPTAAAALQTWDCAIRPATQHCSQPDRHADGSLRGDPKQHPASGQVDRSASLQGSIAWHHTSGQHEGFPKVTHKLASAQQTWIVMPALQRNQSGLADQQIRQDVLQARPSMPAVPKKRCTALRSTQNCIVGHRASKEVHNADKRCTGSTATN